MLFGCGPQTLSGRKETRKSPEKKKKISDSKINVLKKDSEV